MMSSLVQQPKRLEKTGKESIHSGQFMVSQFEAEEQDDEDNLAVPIPETIDAKALVPVRDFFKGTVDTLNYKPIHQQQICIDQSLSKLFQCMSLAYRQKLTSPKWNRFRGIRLRWKDKIRLNNVIWRCWHLQFIKKENTLICQFASPLDVDTHNKPEAIVLEGKYWKRKLAAVTAEYKKWRMFYRNHLCGHTPKEEKDMLNDVDAILADSNSMDNMNMMIDEDYMGLMTDTLFSTITNQPYAFPDTRELAKSGFAELIQPSLGPLQPNLDDYMDTLDSFEIYANNKLPTVPEEHAHCPPSWEFREYTNNPTEISVQEVQNVNQYHSQLQTQQLMDKPLQIQNNEIPPPSYNSVMMGQSEQSYIQTSSYPIISKSNSKLSRGKQGHVTTMSPGYTKSVLDTGSTVYQTYNPQGVEHVVMNERLQVSMAKNCPAQPQRTVVQEMSPSNDQFKAQPSTSSNGYKFSSPGRPNLKFATTNSVNVQSLQSQVIHSQMHASQISYNSNFSSVQKESEKSERHRTTLRGRGRSRSNTREPIKRPPLISAASDTALLTQLLTTSSPLSEAVQAYNQNQGRGSTPDLSQHRRPKDEPGSFTVMSSPSIHPTLSSQITVSVPLTNGDSSYLGTYSSSNNSPLDSPSQNLHSPTSSQGSIGSPGREGSSSSRGDGRRVGHIHAEQKRRVNIKNGFDMIHSLIPQLNQNPNAKVAKAAMLQKGAEYIRQLRSERHQLKEEMDSLRQQIESLNTSISNCQSMLPATGAPVSRRRDSRMQEMFDDYVRKRTMENWKFWIFSLICRPLLNSFNSFVSTSSMEDLYSSTCLWVEQHCTLVDLRPIVLNSLRYLCKETEILSEPEKLPDEARQLVLKKDKN